MLYRVSEDAQLRDSGLYEPQVCGSVTHQVRAHGSLLQGSREKPMGGEAIGRHLVQQGGDFICYDSECYSICVGR